MAGEEEGQGERKDRRGGRVEGGGRERRRAEGKGVSGRMG